MGVDFFQKSLPQAVLIQEMAEVEDGGLVGQRFRQIQTHEPPHRLGLVEQVLHTRVAEIVEELHTMNPQHHRQRIGAAALAGLGVNNCSQFSGF